MPEYQPNPIDPSIIDRPRCPQCHEPRMLRSKTEAGPPGFEYRVFKCQKCGRVHTMIISSDPMEFNTRGWLSLEIEIADQDPGLLTTQTWMADMFTVDAMPTVAGCRAEAKRKTDLAALGGRARKPLLSDATAWLLLADRLEQRDGALGVRWQSLPPPI
jgi:hypothetical protein